jgi:PAS domain-containing protein
VDRLLPPDESNDFHQAHVALLLKSYQRLLQQSLLESSEQSAWGRLAFKANFALLSHNTDQEPLFNYANRAALELFEFSWEELIGMPSRLSAEPVNQQERERLLAKVTAQGFIDDYAGVRISKTGKRFLIQGAVVWNVVDEHGVYHGQAAWFKDWTWL